MEDNKNKYANIKKLVVKVGTSTLTHSSGKFNLKKMDELAFVLSDLKNKGLEVILVTSGAITAGVAKLNLKERPKSVMEKQAAASVGQCELMYIYDKLFSQYGQTVGQILLTKDITENDVLRNNIVNTFNTLFSYNAIPIVNENDTVAVDEIVFGDNDTLSAVTAKLIGADLLIILSDIDGLYDKNPQDYDDAKLIPVVEEITEEIEKLGGKSGSKVGTGGMATKISAAKIATQSGIDLIIINGNNVKSIYEVINGEAIGTLFKAKEV